MKEFVNIRAKYNHLVAKINIYEQNSIPIINKQLDRLEISKAQKLTRKSELLRKVKMMKAQVSKLISEYDMRDLELKSSRVTSTPLPKRWRK